MLRRKKRIAPSDYAEKHIVLPTDSPMPGKWRKDAFAYISGILDASFFPSVQEIIVQAAEQTGKSMLGDTCIAYAADRKPGNVLLMMPDEKTAGEYVQDRLQILFTASRRLRSYYTGYVADQSSLRVKLKHMIIYAAWANSAARLAWRSLPYVKIDEENKMPGTVGKEGRSPVDLARKRTRNYPHMRKVWRMSSPTEATVGITRALYGDADRKIAPDAEVVFVYHAVCPLCGHSQQMVFYKDLPAKREGDEPVRVGIVWEGGRNADPNEVETKKLARYRCEKCLGEWDDNVRDKAVRLGRRGAGQGWYDEKSGLSLDAHLKAHRPRAIGFKVPGWLSPMVSLSECAAAFLRGLKDEAKLKDFYNGYAGEAWQIRKKERSEDRILLLRDERPRTIVPGGGVVAGLLAGIDTQDYGLWYRIRAFSWGDEDMHKESWGVRDGYIPKLGDGGRSDMAMLARILWEDEYRDAAGNLYPVIFTVQDALGHRTSEVYEFCQKNRGRIVPSFGRDNMAQRFTWTRQEFYPGTKKPIPGGLQSVNVNTKYYKDELARLLAIDPADPGAWHENSEFRDDWARHMTAEYVNEKGLWECPGGRDNHLWDCAVLCLVAHDLLEMKTWAKPDSAANETPEPEEPVVRSKFMSG